MDGELLTAEDVKIVVEKLLAYHPRFEDKIGCGLDSIMVSFMRCDSISCSLSNYYYSLASLVLLI